MYFRYCKVRLRNKNKRDGYFHFPDEKLCYYLLNFFVIKHINNHIIKYNKYFAFFTWTVFINFFVDITNVIQFSLKILELS